MSEKLRPGPDGAPESFRLPSLEEVQKVCDEGARELLKKQKERAKKRKAEFAQAAMDGGLSAPIGGAELEGESLVVDLNAIRSLDDLNKIIGEITPEEQVLLDNIDLNAESTLEETAALGSDFTERLVKRTLDEIQNRPEQSLK